VASQIPQCANSVKGNGCLRSDVKLVNENEEAWVFRCETCRCIQVVSKDGVRNQSQFEAMAKRRKEEIELRKARERRRKYFG
jgi:hypothetical protein